MEADMSWHNNVLNVRTQLCANVLTANQITLNE